MNNFLYKYQYWFIEYNTLKTSIQKYCCDSRTINGVKTNHEIIIVAYQKTLTQWK